MISCDHPFCPYEWFHFKCVGMTEAPKDEKWFCDDCRLVKNTNLLTF